MDEPSNQGRVIATKEGVNGTIINFEDVVVPLDSKHSVTGWYTDQECTDGNKVASVTLDGHNVTLYPKVEEGHYLYFSSGEGASYVKPVFVAAKAETAAPDAPTRLGYNFKHWSVTEGGSEYKFGSTISEDTTLYAVWKANTNTKYTVIYWWDNANDRNYSYYENSVRTGTTGNKIDLTEISRNYNGFDLNTKKTIDANADAKIAGDGSTIVNVYYSRNIYDIWFYKYYQYLLFTGKWEEMEDLHISAKYGANISNRWPTSTSKIWGTKRGPLGGIGPYQSGISTMPLGGASFYFVEQKGKYTMNLNYYLQDLDGTSYSLHHTDNFKSDNYRWNTTKEDHYDIEGFNYNGNVKDGTRFSWNKESNAYEVSFEYDRKSYLITFINGDSSSLQNFKYGADISKVNLKTVPERPAVIPVDYVFAGWFDNELCVGDPATLTGTMPAHNITLYAKWKAPTYTAIVHTTMEGTDTPIQLTIDYGNKINENNMPTVMDSDGNIIQESSSSNTVTVPEGHKWVGWAKRSGNDFTIYNFQQALYDNITLYPYYVSNTKYTVTYDVKGGSGTVNDDKKYASGAYADIQSGYDVTAPVGKAAFLYWSLNNDGTGISYYPGDMLRVINDVTLYAVYGDPALTTSLTYKTNYPKGSNQTDEEKLQSVNDSTTLQNNASFNALTFADTDFAVPDDYYFTGWNTKDDGSGTAVAAGENILVDAKENNILFAQWRKKQAVELTVTGKTGSVTYDGTKHSVEGYTIAITVNNTVGDLPRGLKLDESNAEKKAASGKNAGTYKIGLKKEDFSITGNDLEKYSVTIQVEDGYLAIQPREVTLTSASATKAYDGTALTAPGVTVGGDRFVDGEVTDIKATGTITKEGSVENTITYTTTGTFKEKNYNITKYEGKLTILQNATLITVKSADDSKTYDGTPLTNHTITTTGLLDGFTLTAEVTGSITDVDPNSPSGNNTVANAVIKDKEGNVVTDQFSKITYKAGTLSILPRKVTLASKSDSKPYDGTALTAPEVTVGGTDGLAQGQSIEYKFIGSQTYVGSSPNTFTYIIKDNYGNIVPVSEVSEKKVPRKAFAKKISPKGQEGNYLVTVAFGTLTVTDNVKPEMVVTKTHDEKAYQLGEQIVFEISVTNIYDTAQTITLTEQDGVVFTGKYTFTDVEPGKTVTTSAFHVVNEDDLEKGTYTNTVKADFKEVKKTWEGTDTEDQFAHLTLKKEVTNAPADGTAYMNGETISYRITVTNDGTTELHSLNIADSLTGDEWNNGQSLASGEKLTFDTAYKVTVKDAENGFVTNQAVGSAQDANGNIVKPEPASVRVPVQKAKPSLYLEKTSDKDKAVDLGETIHYTIRVVNNGNTAVSDVVVTDEMTGDSWNAGTLKPGEDKTFHTEYVVTEKDILAGSVKNVALADGKDPNGDKPDVTPGEKENKTVPENAHLTVTKKTVSSPKNHSGYAVGETIRYQIEAFNDGNLTLTDVEVTDPLTGETWKVEKLAPGEKQTFETKYTVTEKDQSAGKVVNKATAKGKTPGKTKLIVVPGTTSDSVLPKENEVVTTSTAVPTGDSTQTGAYLAMLFIAAAGIMILSRKKKEERRK
jgi:uncharacterized repeat protein (TIGR01451 family)/uncharacterized repeat protein (TIGR02543 family)